MEKIFESVNSTHDRKAPRKLRRLNEKEFEKEQMIRVNSSGAMNFTREIMNFFKNATEYKILRTNEENVFYLTLFDSKTDSPDILVKTRLGKSSPKQGLPYLVMNFGSVLRRLGIDYTRDTQYFFATLESKEKRIIRFELKKK